MAWQRAPIAFVLLKAPTRDKDGSELDGPGESEEQSGVTGAPVWNEAIPDRVQLLRIVLANLLAVGAGSR